MGFERFVQKVARKCGFDISRASSDMYDQDGLRSVHNHDFMNSPFFIDAYQRAVQAGRGVDNRIHWRIHVALWVADCASKLRGDFVECGVNTGATSSAIMQYLRWGSLGKTFYLLDTFHGMDQRFITEQERLEGKLALNQRVLDSGGYELDVTAVKQNFSEWQRVIIIKGAVPETLSQVEAEAVAFLHLDMNCSVPEQAAAEYFWPRLVPGAFMLLDDYAYQGYVTQKIALDSFALSRGVTVLSLPTGQGLIIKPPF